MWILLPPSEGKAPGGRGRYADRSGVFGDALDEPRRAVREALVGSVAPLRTDAPKRTLSAANGVSAPATSGDRTATAIAALGNGDAPVLPAWQRYTGVVWTHLDPATLPPADRRRVLVPSALLGLVAGTDPVPDHRLKFSVSLPGIGRLDRFWRPHLTGVLRRRRGLVVDLLPNEHAAAIDWSVLERGRDVVHVRFVTRDGGGAAGHAAKAVKGVFARTLLERGVDMATTFVWEGWTAERPDSSTIVVRSP